MSETEKKSVITILRSLVNSLKNASISDLVRDFGQLEGGCIPYQKFGFSNLADFLISTGQFHVNGYGNVFAKCTAESAHISKLVAEQNSSKKKKVKRFIQPQRHLHPSTVRYPPQHQTAMMGPRRPFNSYPPTNYPPINKNYTYPSMNWYHHKNK